MLDRKSGGQLGAWKLNIDEAWFPYIEPQETGNRIDVRQASFTDADGKDLPIRALEKPLEMTAHPFDAADLKNTRHPCDLEKQDYVALHIDHHQMGIGGINSGGVATPIPPAEAQQHLPLELFAGTGPLGSTKVVHARDRARDSTGGAILAQALPRNPQTGSSFGRRTMAEGSVIPTGPPESVRHEGHTAPRPSSRHPLDLHEPRHFRVASRP